MEGGEGRIRLPIPAYLIEHPNGTALFDTGMHPDCQHDPASRVGARIAGLFEFDYKPGEGISARLGALGRGTARARRSVASTRAISISATNCGWSTASTMYSATAQSCVCRRMATRRDINP